jgi:hypothetical protein
MKKCALKRVSCPLQSASDRRLFASAHTANAQRYQGSAALLKLSDGSFTSARPTYTPACNLLDTLQNSTLPLKRRTCACPNVAWHRCQTTSSHPPFRFVSERPSATVQARVNVAGFPVGSQCARHRLLPASTRSGQDIQSPRSH